MATARGAGRAHAGQPRAQRDGRPTAADRYESLASFLASRSWPSGGHGGSLEAHLAAAVERRFDDGVVSTATDVADCVAVVDDAVAVLAVSGARLNDSRTVRQRLRAAARRYPYLVVCGLRVSGRRRDTWRSLQRNFARSHLDADGVAFVDVSPESAANPDASPRRRPDARLLAAAALAVGGATVVGLALDANATAAGVGASTLAGAGALYLLALSVAGYVGLAG